MKSAFDNSFGSLERKPRTPEEVAHELAEFAFKETVKVRANAFESHEGGRQFNSPELVIVDLDNNRDLRALTAPERERALDLIFHAIGTKLGDPLPLDQSEFADVRGAISTISLTPPRQRFGIINHGSVEIPLDQAVYKSSIPGLFLIDQSIKRVTLTSDGQTRTVGTHKQSLSLLLRSREDGEPEFIS